MPLRKKSGPPSDAWLVTFADLVSLLITFFVLLFSMKNINTQRWQDIRGALSGALAFEEINQQNVDTDNIETINITQADDLTYLKAILGQRFKSDDVLKEATMVIRDRGDELRITVPSRLLFKTGSASLMPQGDDAIGRLGDMLRNIDNSIIIAGHTDPVPIQGGVYESNWELSMLRAVGVLKKLRATGVVSPMQALGYADSRFDMIQSDLPVTMRYLKARRVETTIGKATTNQRLP